MLRRCLNLLCAVCLILSACTPDTTPATPVLTPTAAAPSPTPTTPPSPTAPATAPPAATSTPLARIVSERPTPVPAPGCFAAGWPPSSDKAMVTSLAVAQSNRIFAAVYNPALSRTKLVVSDDEGSTWANVYTFFDFVSKIAPSPAFSQDRTVYAAGAGGVYRSLSGGSNWAVITLPTWVTTTAIVRQLAVSPNFDSDRTILLASRAAPRGVFASTDGGATWIDWLVDAVDALLFSPDYALDHAVWVARNDDQNFRRDVLVTVDQGTTWAPVRAGSALPLALSPAFAQDSTIIWSDPGGGLYVSRNGDKVFPSLEKARADALSIYRQDPQSGWIAAGEQPVSAVVFSPDFGRDRSAYALADSSLLVSRDGGGSWAPLCYWNFDAQSIDAQRLTQLVVTHGKVPVLVAGGAGARVAISRDGGTSWTSMALP